MSKTPEEQAFIDETYEQMQKAYKELLDIMNNPPRTIPIVYGGANTGRTIAKRQGHSNQGAFIDAANWTAAQPIEVDFDSFAEFCKGSWPKCECGGDKLESTHSTWCAKYAPY